MSLCNPCKATKYPLKPGIIIRTDLHTRFYEGRSSHSTFVRSPEYSSRLFSDPCVPGHLMTILRTLTFSLETLNLTLLGTPTSVPQRDVNQWSVRACKASRNAEHAVHERGYAISERCITYCTDLKVLIWLQSRIRARPGPFALKHISSFSRLSKSV